ncbi:MAG TPA: hypothetical protein VGE66_10205 [Chitinophagaceae bacterium]
MAKGIHKGSELRNVSETWDENERKRAGSHAPGRDDPASDDTAGGNDLQQVIKDEAAEYDQDHKEDRLLGGERASVNDDDLNTPNP